MLRSQLVQRLTNADTAVRAADADRAVTTFFDQIAQRLAQGGRVELRGFGSFGLRGSDARIARNPLTAEPVAVPATRHVRFKAGAAIKARLNRR